MTMDMERLERDVLNQGPGSALPSKLSDEVLDEAISDLEDFFGTLENGSGGRKSLPGPLGMVLKILFDQNKCDSDGRVQLSQSELLEHLQSYLVELGLEKVNRCTDIAIEAATLENIFAPNRQVNVNRRLDVLQDLL